jgi:hypothetical protein
MHLPKPEFQIVPANGMLSFGKGGGQEDWAEESEPVKPLVVLSISEYRSHKIIKMRLH